jgi:hypothetical protein
VSGSEEPRLAFAARGRVWIAKLAPATGEGRAAAAHPDQAATAHPDQAATAHPDGSVRSERWIATPVPGWSGPDSHQDRPVWLPGGERLALTVWIEGYADLAITAGDSLENLTRTPGRDELLDDVSPDGQRLLFESEHSLWEMRLADGQVRPLTRGRDGRYTTDGRRVLFVRGHHVSALGIWREGYSGGDDSEIMLLDLDSGEIRALTNNANNDEQPIPLDASGTRYVMISEGSGVYQPWFVEPWGPRTQRIRRPDLPGLERPIRFPDIRHLGDQRYELWMEYEGDLHYVRATRTDSALVSGEVVRIELELGGIGADDDRRSSHPGLIERLLGGVQRRSHDPSWFGAALYENARLHLSRGPLTADRWRAIPRATRQRFRAELARVHTHRAAAELCARLCGRFGLSHLYYEPTWGLPTVPPIASDGETEALAAALRLRGIDMLGLGELDHDQLDRVTAERDRAEAAVVLDLRDCRGGDAVDAYLRALCGAEAPESSETNVTPLLCLISEHTHGAAEVLVDRLRTDGCAVLVGRPTAGAALETVAYPIDVGGRLVVPTAFIDRSDGRPYEGNPVMVRAYVQPAIDSAEEDWLRPTLRAAHRLGALPASSE